MTAPDPQHPRPVKSPPPGPARTGGPGAAPSMPPAAAGPVPADGMMPLWAVSLRWELRRGRQVVLDGAIRDRWWFEDRPASFRSLVAGALEAWGAEVVGWWDPVDGLTFPLAGHAERFDGLVAALHREHRAPPPEEQPREAPRTAGTDRRGEREGAGGAVPAPATR
ncbi:hypothetical protein GA0115261_113402, partial [Streptomyces sp. OspMP-M43]